LFLAVHFDVIRHFIKTFDDHLRVSTRYEFAATMGLLDAYRLNVRDVEMMNGSRSVFCALVCRKKVLELFQTALDDPIEVFVLDILSLPNLFDPSLDLFHARPG
jgi:hypothetical protein